MVGTVGESDDTIHNDDDSNEDSIARDIILNRISRCADGRPVGEFKYILCASSLYNCILCFYVLFITILAVVDVIIYIFLHHIKYEQM